MELVVTLTRPKDAAAEFEWGWAGAMFGKGDEGAAVRVSTMD